MYERFTDRARKIMQLANQEAMRLKHEYIGTEHILLGLLKEGTGTGARALKALKIDFATVRGVVEKIIVGHAASFSEKLPQTPRAKRVIEFAIEEARTLNHDRVGTEHLLLGLLREEEGVAGQVLRKLKLDLADVREQVLILQGHDASQPLVVGKTEELDLPPLLGKAIKAIEESLEWLQQMKDAAVDRSDFEWAASLWSQADQLRKMRLFLLRERHREPPDHSA